MKEPINILHPGVAEMLKIMEKVFRELEIDFFLVGAVARDIRLAADKQFASQRGTRDVDIAILVSDEAEFNAVKNELLKTGDFKECDDTDIRLMYKEGTEVDLLPFGEIENDRGKVHLNKHGLLAMDMGGFKRVYPFVETLMMAEGLSLNVCTVEGLIILKLIARDDNPARTKDITDIEHFIEVYFDLNQNEIFESYLDVMDLYETDIENYTQLISARVAGRKIKDILNDAEDISAQIKIILAKRPVAAWQTMLKGMND